MSDKFTLILFSGDYDKAMAAFTLANGAAGNHMDVTIFFTFWGVSLLRSRNQPRPNFLENLFKSMMPSGTRELGLSKMNFGGLGPKLMRKLITQKKGQTLDDLLAMAKERKIRFVACEASLKLLGIEPSELIDYEHLEVAGVDCFLNNAIESKVALFI
ncbi:MAG TPA: DsrE/DsrF/DrsH-like family protein [Bacillota bacterium]|nr:DsrE/DsrF/DrsH-like family protein [Bacillota bacterium]HPT86931.1 DsrE/DsrF/DrsH-like family protein [Bacillota bacterium]